MAQVQSIFPNLFESDEAPTPLMAQYLSLKSQHPDCLLFFRLGDFYELFFGDAIKASGILDIALTKRGQYQGEDVPMCGVPAHAYEAYLARLIREGCRVALCEQTESPSEAKKRGSKSLVTREIVRIVTPGTVVEESLLDARTSTYLMCYLEEGKEAGIAWIDLSSGQPLTERGPSEEIVHLIHQLEPAEILVLSGSPSPRLAPFQQQLTPMAAATLDSKMVKRHVLDFYKITDLAAYGSFTDLEIMALGALLSYVALTQKDDRAPIMPPRHREARGGLYLDPATRRNLELTQTLQGKREGSLLSVIDRTRTAAGARLLTQRVLSPLGDSQTINIRLNEVSAFIHERAFHEEIRHLLTQGTDLERALARLTLHRGGPRDLGVVRAVLRLIAAIRLSEPLILNKDGPLRGILDELGEHSELEAILERALGETLPLQARDGNFIAAGYSEKLDEYRHFRDESRTIVGKLQNQYADLVGVPSLKIKHNLILGYYIEVTPSHAEKLLARKDIFIHRQGLSTSVRFTSLELSEYEQKINEAAAKIIELELSLFNQLIELIKDKLVILRKAACALAQIDVAASLAALALEWDYVRPEICESSELMIEAGRHPVIEQTLRGDGQATSFIANNCDFTKEARLWLITGPNMAGKSTFLRQNALIVLLAQIGSYVPAKKAKIGLVDRLFSRVGAADDLARGQSTFMVEMVETATILHQATQKSLVILDEIGRGTATYDGLSIAWATLEYLHNVNMCRAIFATHYHELTQLSTILSSLECHTMRIKEWNNEIVFLHEVIPGAADRSYGVHVAQMAGIPRRVIDRAFEILTQLESNKSNPDVPNVLNAMNKNKPFEAAHGERALLSARLQDKLRQANPDQLTPKQALELLYEVKALLE